MKDYEKLFTTNLHSKLKKHIIGKIFVKIRSNDEIYIKIESIGNLKFEMVVPNFSERMMNGMTSEFVAYEVVNSYRNYILGKYFLK